MKVVGTIARQRLAPSVGSGVLLGRGFGSAEGRAEREPNVDVGRRAWVNQGQWEGGGAGGECKILQKFCKEWKMDEEVGGSESGRLVCGEVGVCEFFRKFAKERKNDAGVYESKCRWVAGGVGKYCQNLQKFTKSERPVEGAYAPAAAVAGGCKVG